MLEKSEPPPKVTKLEEDEDEEDDKAEADDEEPLADDRAFSRSVARCTSLRALVYSSSAGSLLSVSGILFLLPYVLLCSSYYCTLTLLAVSLSLQVRAKSVQDRFATESACEDEEAKTKELVPYL